MNTTQISTEKGFQDRNTYLDSLAIKFNFSIEFITIMADAYDQSNDFDGLIEALAIYSEKEIISQENANWDEYSIAKRKDFLNLWSEKRLRLATNVMFHKLKNDILERIMVEKTTNFDSLFTTNGFQFDMAGEILSFIGNDSRIVCENKKSVLTNISEALEAKFRHFIEIEKEKIENNSSILIKS